MYPGNIFSKIGFETDPNSDTGKVNMSAPPFFTVFSIFLKKAENEKVSGKMLKNTTRSKIPAETESEFKNPPKKGYVSRALSPPCPLAENLKSETVRKWFLAPKIRNRIKKSSNGNIGRIGQISKSLCIIHWNSGPTRWVNRRDELNNLTRDYNPDLIFISEAALYNYNTDYETFIDGYSLISAKTIEEHGYSRLNLLVKNGIEVKVMHNLMDKNM